VRYEENGESSARGMQWSAHAHIVVLECSCSGGCMDAGESENNQDGMEMEDAHAHGTKQRAFVWIDVRNVELC